MTPVNSLPHSFDSEILVLGVMLNSINAINLGLDSLDPCDFYVPANKTIFEAFKAFFEKDAVVDEHLLIEHLKSVNRLAEVGGIAYIKNLSLYSECFHAFAPSVEIIKNFSVLRQLRNVGAELAMKALSPENSGYELIEEAQKAIFKISQGRNSNSGKLLKDILNGKYSESGKTFIQEVEERQRLFKETGGKGVPFKGVKSGFVDLDKQIDGLGNSHLVILAARPAMGKTALALNIAENVAPHCPVGVFSLEMRADELVNRLICSAAEIDKSKIVTGQLMPAEFHAIYAASKKMQAYSIVIDDESRLKIRDLCVRARRMKESHGIGMLIIDYLQLIGGSDKYGGRENRQVEVADISRNLKLLAKELNIPVLCLAQLNRQVEQRADHIPLLSDLRESGSLEQDSDVVLLFHRPEVYNSHDKPGLAYLNIAKNRHGPIGNVELIYRKEFAKFGNYAKPTHQNAAYEYFTP